MRLVLQAARLAAICCTLALGLGATAANAQATSTSQVATTIVGPLSLLKYADMDFGKIVSPLAPGKVILNPTPTPTCTVTGGLTRTGNCQAATFFGYGDAGRLVNINRPNSPITISNGTQTMTITNVTMNGDPNLAFVSGNPNGNGVLRYRILTGLFSFRIGGTLNVAAGQAGGVYTGTFSVSILYQ